VILRNRRCGLVSAIVAALRFSTDEGMPKLLLVTSTRLAEGKSSSALAIAQNPPADLLSTGRIRKIIGEAKEGFDLVVIDGPPTLGLADAPLLAAAAGNVLFAIENGKTRTRAAIEALNGLEATGTHMLGAILSKAEESATGYGRYGHGYGYGYGYGAKGRLKKAEILMIPQGSDEDQDADVTRADA
jgi:Mrp family chromosome partitioning ATPase